MNWWGSLEAAIKKIKKSPRALTFENWWWLLEVAAGRDGLGAEEEEEERRWWRKKCFRKWISCGRFMWVRALWTFGVTWAPSLRRRQAVPRVRVVLVVVVVVVVVVDNQS
jgi:hypothetical protein